jgi:1-acyl-sn-glycerol-3-phosphate acyltransferase
MSVDDLLGFTKSELLAMAREAGLRGRSRMTKAELATALGDQAREAAPSDTGDDEGDGEVTVIDRGPAANGPSLLELLSDLVARGPGAKRRSALAARHRTRVDEDRQCSWRSLEGHPCGLPVVRGSDQCVLHGGLEIMDLAVPITGRLGFDTWPTLLRHLQLGSYDVDPLGLDPVVAEMGWHLLNFMYFDYFRIEVEGIENIPDTGGAMLVANHGGAAIPYDGLMMAISVANEAKVPRRVRVTGTELFNIVPWLSPFFRKAGGAYAARGDAEFLLKQGHLLGVFPEGERGFMKPIWDAYEVQRFGRGGFVQIAEKAGAPIVPVAIVGSEEVHPAVTVSKTLGRLVRLLMPDQRVEGVAVFLNPIPLPVKWHIRFMEPIPPDNPGQDPEPLWVLERTEHIRSQIQRRLDQMLSERETLW